MIESTDSSPLSNNRPVNRLAIMNKSPSVLGFSLESETKYEFFFTIAHTTFPIKTAFDLTHFKLHISNKFRLLHSATSISFCYCLYFIISSINSHISPPFSHLREKPTSRTCSQPPQQVLEPVPFSSSVLHLRNILHNVNTLVFTPADA